MLKTLFRLNICLLLLVTACSKKDSSIQDPFDPSVSKTIKNEKYGSLAIQTADVYLPANRGVNTKTLIMIHGGFWTSGDKTDLDSLIQPLRSLDPTLAIINVNYTLADGSPSTIHPAQMNDFDKLLDYIDAHNADWHIGNKYAIAGVSSGAHLGMVYTYKYDTEKRIKVMATVLGPTNFADSAYITSPLFQQLSVNLLGKTWQQDSALHKSVSPIFLVNENSVPTFMAYGGSDPLVPITNPYAFHEKLTALNVPHEFFFYPTESHDLSLDAIGNIFMHLGLFLNEYFK